MNKQQSGIIAAIVFLLSTNNVFADNLGISTTELEKARYNLLSHKDVLEKQYSESEKLYESYLRRADEEKKRLDSLNYAIKQNEDALRRVEESLRSY